MKSMSCKQLGGACNIEFQAATFEEIAEMSRKHGEEMAALKDEPHLAAMQEMMNLMQNPADMQAWMDARKVEFENATEV